MACGNPIGPEPKMGIEVVRVAISAFSSNFFQLRKDLEFKSKIRIMMEPLKTSSKKNFNFLSCENATWMRMVSVA